MSNVKNCPLMPITELLASIIDNRGKSCPTVENGFPLIATNCIKHNSIYPSFENVRYVSDDVLNTWFRAELKPNDILFVNKGTPGRVCLVPDPITFCAAQDMIGLRADSSKIYYKYLFAVLRSDFVQQKIANFHVGIAIPHFKKSDMDNLLIPVPDMNVQIKIGDMYCELSEKIENNNKINAELEAMAKTIYDYWFLQFEFPNEEGKPYKSSGGKMVWCDELKQEIPACWKPAKVKYCINHINTGLNPRDNFKLGNGSVKYITVKNLTTDGTIDFKNCDVIDEDARNIVHMRSDVSKNDILFASIAPLGRCTIVQENPKDWDINESVFCIRPKLEKVSPEYLYLFLTSDYFVKKAEHSSTGSIFSGIRISVLEDMPILIPDKTTMDNFTKAASKLLFMKYKNRMENQELASLRDFLLPMLMNGQVGFKS